MRRKQSIGSTIMVLQEQYNHQQRLHAIYSRSRPTATTLASPNYSHLHHNYSKKQRYEDEQHLLTIRQLFQTLNKGKIIAQRNKDPHDFFAYPALFFREVEKIPKKTKKRQKTHMKKVKTVPHLSQDTPKISLEKVRQFLPILTNFQQSDFEQFTDGINKMIISFDIITREQLQSLSQKVMSLLPQRCPQHFVQAVALAFQQIEQQMDE